MKDIIKAKEDLIELEVGIYFIEIDHSQFSTNGLKNNSGGYEPKVQQVAKKIVNITF